MTLVKELTDKAKLYLCGNVWLTDSVPPDTKVFLKRPELVYIDRSR